MPLWLSAVGPFFKRLSWQTTSGHRRKRRDALKTHLDRQNLTSPSWRGEEKFLSGGTQKEWKLTSSSMETLLFGSASVFRLMLTGGSEASAAAQRIKSFLAGWNFPQVRLKLPWTSWWRLNLRREDVLRWGRADEDGEVSVEIWGAVLRERIIHEREGEKWGKEKTRDALN